MLYNARTEQFLNSSELFYALTVQIHGSTRLSHVSSKLCFSQALLVNSQTIQDLALSPLHDAISPRILALTCRLRTFPKPLITLAFRFITRPLRYPGLPCSAATSPFLALPLQYKLFLALPSLRQSQLCYTLAVLCLTLLYSAFANLIRFGAPHSFT